VKDTTPDSRPWPPRTDDDYRQEAVILLGGGRTPSKIVSAPYIAGIVRQDVVASVVVFACLLALHSIIRGPVARRWLTRALTCILAVYAVYIIFYIEFFRLFESQLNLSYLIQVPSLMLYPNAAMSDMSELPLGIVALNTALSASLIALSSKPGLLKRVKWIPPETKKALTYAILLAVGSVLACQIASHMGYGIEDEHGISVNPLYRMVSSAINRMSFMNYQGLTDGIEEKAVIDGEYPLMRGSEYAICGNAQLRERVRFREFCLLDEDGDGFSKSLDCDDSDPDVNPSAAEVPYDGVDDNCDISDDPPMNVVLLRDWEVSIEK